MGKSPQDKEGGGNEKRRRDEEGGGKAKRQAPEGGAAGGPSAAAAALHSPRHRELKNLAFDSPGIKASTPDFDMLASAVRTRSGAQILPLDVMLKEQIDQEDFFRIPKDRSRVEKSIAILDQFVTHLDGSPDDDGDIDFEEGASHGSMQQAVGDTLRSVQIQVKDESQGTPSTGVMLGATGEGKSTFANNAAQVHGNLIVTLLSRTWYNRACMSIYVRSGGGVWIEGPSIVLVCGENVISSQKKCMLFKKKSHSGDGSKPKPVRSQCPHTQRWQREGINFL